jgi:hypothetical protein
VGSSITAFATIMFEVAPNFDEYPLVRKILHDGDSNPDDAIFDLPELLTEEDWEEISELADQSVWKEQV